MGGLFTMGARLGMIIYLVLEMKQVIEKKSTITTTQYIKNTALDPTEYHITAENFDFAVRPNY